MDYSTLCWVNSHDVVIEKLIDRVTDLVAIKDAFDYAEDMQVPRLA